MDSDKIQVISLWKNIFRDDPPWNEPVGIIERKSAFQADLFLVGIINHAIIATVIAGYDGFRGWIYHLAVHSEMRRQGIARKMMQKAEEMLKQKGCIKINLQIRSYNSQIIEFYKSIGYNIEDHLSMGKLT